jgi:hypothetical protein
MTNSRRDTQWRAVDAERSPLADTLDGITVEQWNVQDVRRPLGIPYAFPPAAAITVADRLARSNLLFGAKRRIGGLRLVADDVSWSCGTVPTFGVRSRP